MTTPTLYIIGGGPKAIAVAAKARILRDLGRDAPTVHIIEAVRLAHHWRGSGGWTDGRQTLGTSPLKDIGFPYLSTGSAGGNEVDEAMLRLSWPAHLSRAGALAHWIDRGAPNPSHREWAEYLEWVASEAGASVIPGEALRIDRGVDRPFTITVAGVGPVHGDAVMITGFGSSGRTLSPHCLSVRDFWTRRAQGKTFDGRRVVVIGSGETSAAITTSLVETSEPADLVVVSPTETIYSRGESYLENRLFSDAGAWRGLTEEQRRGFIRRTDRAVFSQHVQERISRRGIHRHVSGRVVDVTREAQGPVAHVVSAPGERARRVEADVVIDARGGDPLWFADLLDPALRDDIAAHCGGALTAAALEQRIGRDLSLSGFGDKIFVPNLAAMRQGPGFPNLSSLGVLSDRILSGLRSERELQPARATVAEGAR